MTEHDWLTGTDPAAMLRLWTEGPHPISPGARASDRQLRLFTVACCRSVWHLLTDKRSRRAVEVAELYADGQATEQELIDANYDADHIPIWDIDGAVVASLWIAHRHLAGSPIASIMAHTCDFATQSALLRDIFGNPWRPVKLPEVSTCPKCMGSGGWGWGTYGEEEERRIREGEPTAGWHTCRTCHGSGRQVTRQELLAWHEGLIPRLAEAAYQERERTCERCKGEGHVPSYTGMYRLGSDPCKPCKSTGRINDGTLDPQRLAVLADALEEAGCQQEEILQHLRGWRRCQACIREGGRHAARCECARHDGWVHRPYEPHARGCFAVDLLTGRQ